MPKKGMCGLNTDASRGSTREGLAKEMNKYSRTYLLNKLLITTYYHYSFNLIMVLLSEKYFSDSSISN